MPQLNVVVLALPCDDPGLGNPLPYLWFSGLGSPLLNVGTHVTDFHACLFYLLSRSLFR